MTGAEDPETPSGLCVVHLHWLLKTSDLAPLTASRGFSSRSSDTAPHRQHVNRLDDSVPLDPEHRRKAVQDLADHQLATLVAIRFVVIASDTFDDGDVLEALAHLDTYLIHDVAEGRFSADRRSSPVAAQSLMALAQYGVAAAIESYGEHVGPSLGKVPAVNVEVALRPGENQLLDVEQLVPAGAFPDQASCLEHLGLLHRDLDQANLAVATAIFRGV